MNPQQAFKSAYRAQRVARNAKTLSPDTVAWYLGRDRRYTRAAERSLYDRSSCGYSAQDRASWRAFYAALESANRVWAFRQLVREARNWWIQ